MLARRSLATVMRNRLARCCWSGHRLRLRCHLRLPRAPDLALTQFLVETLTLVIFVLVLRTLRRTEDPAPGGTGFQRCCCRWRSAPPSPPWRRSRWAARTTPIAELLPDAAYYRGHGANTVNVCWSTSAPGTPWARSRCWWSPPPGWPRWCSATAVLVRRHGFRRHHRPADIGTLRCIPAARRRRPGCAAANCATRATARWCSRSRPG